MPTPDRDSTRRLLRPGDTCWRVERARRMALIVDAADYFAAVKRAMLKARQSILLIGWDFDLRIKLDPDSGEDEVPDELGQFLRFIVRTRPELEICILKWDMAVLKSFARQIVPIFVFDVLTHRRLHLRLDSAHPPTSAHHQKIVVIDDSVAFCGGIDMTDDRWDTRDHAPDDPRRVRPDGSAFGPWHDATAAVDGPAARALGELARARWEHAGGHRLPPAKAGGDCWPEGLVPQLREVDVAIARTMPVYGGREAIREIERLYLAAIAAARRYIYVESQYFASPAIAAALCARLREPDGPEIVVVNPRTADGWLEEETMGSARDLLLRQVEAADRWNRFRLCWPVNDAREPIYVHAKLLIVDDRLLRIGSSNLNNRSLGFDSECDLAVAAEAEDHVADVIRRFRDGLLAEHLGVPMDLIGEAVAACGSLCQAIDRLWREHGRTLEPGRAHELAPLEVALVESRLLDPEKPCAIESRLAHLAKRAVLSAPPKAIVGGIVAGAFVAALARARHRRRRLQQLRFTSR